MKKYLYQIAAWNIVGGEKVNETILAIKADSEKEAHDKAVDMAPREFSDTITVEQNGELDEDISGA